MDVVLSDVAVAVAHRPVLLLLDVRFPENGHVQCGRAVNEGQPGQQALVHDAPDVASACSREDGDAVDLH